MPHIGGERADCLNMVICHIQSRGFATMLTSDIMGRQLARPQRGRETGRERREGGRKEGSCRRFGGGKMLLGTLAEALGDRQEATKGASLILPPG